MLRKGHLEHLVALGARLLGRSERRSWVARVRLATSPPQQGKKTDRYIRIRKKHMEAN